MLQSPGEKLIDLCRNATKEVFFAAPFIKYGALKKLLESIPSNLERVTIVTRWSAEEIVVGASDLEVFDLVGKFQNTTLLLHPCLHAKLYRSGENCLVGSANITSKALGWTWLPNIEILVNTDASYDAIKSVENLLLYESIVATEAVYLAMRLEVEQLKSTKSEQDFKTNQGDENYTWLPICSNPNYLYQIYSNYKVSSLLDSVVQAGQIDLQVLQLPKGMTEPEFNRFVATILSQLPITHEINFESQAASLTTDRAVGIVNKYSQMLESINYADDIYWQILKNWLVHFFPDKYRIRSSVEVFEQARVISS